jgi:glycerophosphoryl diester phosphodiesterase
MWFDLPRPVVVGHRGDSLHAPENTLSAFEAAFEAGADAIEFDVKLTTDKQVVVIHDQVLDRTTDGTGRVTKKSLVELRRLDAGSHFADKFRGELIPTLDEVFGNLGQKLFMNIELTNYFTPFDGLVPAVVELVRKHRMQERIIFSSFFASNLKLARRFLPTVPCGLLTFKGWVGAAGRTFGWRGKTYAALHPFVTDVEAGMIDRVHAAGKRYNVWTVNAAEELRRLIGLGVDGLITDDPGLACTLLGRRQ